MDNPQPFSEIPGLLDSMVSHRRRVVAQIAGTPAMALNAAVGRGHTALVFADNTAPAPAWRAWIEQKAAQNYVVEVLYDTLIPWGKKEVRDRRNHQNRVRLGEKARAEIEAEIIDKETQPNQADVAFLSEQDQRLIDALVAKGGLLQRPELRNGPLNLKGFGPHAMGTPRGTNFVFMEGDRLGDFYGSLAALPYPEFANLGKNIEQIRPESGDKPMVYRRWMVLIHEAAHCDFAAMPAPFKPTVPGWSEEAVGKINQWVMGDMALGSPSARTLLNENHSDALSAMLLLEATGHDPEAINTVRRAWSQRAHNRDQLELFEKKHNPQRPTGAFPTVHATEWTLKRVMEDIDSWKGKPLPELREKALEYASNGLVDFLDPNRKLSNGKKVGNAHLQHFLAAEPSIDRIRSQLGLAVLAHAQGHDVESWLSEKQSTSPAGQVIHEAFAQARPFVDAALDQPLFTDASISLRDCASKAPRVACDAIDSLLTQNVHACQPQSRQAQALAEAYRQDLPVMQQALGISPAPSLPLMGAWRKAREIARGITPPEPFMAHSPKRHGLG